MKYFILVCSLVLSSFARAGFVQIADSDLLNYKMAAIKAVHEMVVSPYQPLCVVTFPAVYAGNSVELDSIVEDLYKSQIGFLDNTNGQPLLRFEIKLQLKGSDYQKLTRIEITTSSDKKTIKSVDRVYSIQDYVSTGTLDMPFYNLVVTVQNKIQCLQN